MAVSIVTLPPTFAEESFQPTFDPSRTSTSNIVDNEVHFYTSPQSGERTVIIPRHSPFFVEGFTAEITENGITRTLIPGSDFKYVLPFLSGTRACNKLLHGGIELINVVSGSSVKLRYSPIGGEWVFRKTLSQANAFVFNNEVRLTAWEQYANYQTDFPQVFGAWDMADQTTLLDVCYDLISLQQKIASKSIARRAEIRNFISHSHNSQNPHGWTKSSFGLSNVRNLRPASDVEAADPTNDDTYISHLQLRIAFETATPGATDTSPGISKRIDPSHSTASISQTEFLTAPSLITIVGQPSSDLGRALNRAQKEGSFSGKAWKNAQNQINFPFVWQGNSHTSVESLRKAIADFLSVTSIELDYNAGKIWIPADCTMPPLVLT
jgi:hypothetical protein